MNGLAKIGRINSQQQPAQSRPASRATGFSPRRRAWGTWLTRFSRPRSRGSGTGQSPLVMLIALTVASLACARSEAPITPVRIAWPSPSVAAPIATPTPHIISFVPSPTPVEATATPEAISLVPANVATADALATALLLTATPVPVSEPIPTTVPIVQPAVAYPFISGISARAREIFLRGRELGNRPNVFSKIGDSITESAVFLNPIGNKAYFLYDDYAYLQSVVDYFSTEAARDRFNSFNNLSLAARTNWRARAVFSPASANADVCNPGEAPLPCEIRLVRPALALIMLGTNDVPYTPLDEYEADMRRVIEYSIERGVIPVLSTIPHLEREGLNIRAEQLNEIIVRLAQEYDIPLWDFYAALDALPNQGVGKDGIHPTWAPVGHSADFTAPYLDYGMTIRNVMALQVLDVMWREVLSEQ